MLYYFYLNDVFIDFLASEKSYLQHKKSFPLEKGFRFKLKNMSECLF